MKITKYLSQFGAILILMGLTVPAFALAAGYIQLPDGLSSVASKPAGTTSSGGSLIGKPSGPDSENSSSGSPGTSDFSAEQVYLTNLSKAMSYTSIDGLTDDRTSVSLTRRREDYERLMAAYGVYTEGNALMSVEDYDPELYEITLGGSYSLPYSSGTTTVTKYRKEVSNKDASYVTVSQKVTVERQSVVPYMGYLLISSENGSKIALCDSFGNILSDNIAGFEPAYARDQDNRPVFTDGSLSYVFDSESAAMVPIESTAIRVALSYDYPATSYGEDGFETQLCDDGLYRFLRLSTGRYRFTEYFRAFNFSEGYAIIESTLDNSVRIINTSGTTAFNPDTWYDYHTGVVGQVMSVGDRYALPDTVGIESVGYQGYDNGWLRLRVITYSQNYQTRGKVVKDTDRLVDYKGNPFDIPDGYTLEGYSDGVLLLQKDGKYGYYTIDHKWIAQPIYTYATPFIQGLAVVGYTDGTVGMIDTSGNIVLPFVFTSLSTPSSGIIVGYNEAVGYRVFCISAVGGE
ncbi:MAG: WG repeat-containing protein [Eubacteriales bacterium]